MVLVGNAQVAVGGDFITGVEGKPVTQEDALTRAIQRKHAGDTLDLTVLRNGRTINVKVTLSALVEEAF